MNSEVLQAIRRLSKASKHAYQLRSSLNKLVHLLPESHKVWHEMADEARRIELRLETMLAIIEDLLARDPEACATLLLDLHEPHAGLLPVLDVQAGASQRSVLPCICDSSVGFEA